MTGHNFVVDGVTYVDLRNVVDDIDRQRHIPDNSICSLDLNRYRIGIFCRIGRIVRIRLMVIGLVQPILPLSLTIQNQLAELALVFAAF